MDVLVAEDDNPVSLEEALAFIDACDVNGQVFPDALGIMAPACSAAFDPLQQMTPAELLTPKAPTPQPKQKQATPRRKLSESSSQGDQPARKRRTRSAASSSTRLQQRKRAEIQALREQAQELEAQVALLKKNKFLPGDSVLELDAELGEAEEGVLVVQDTTKKPPATWHEMAIQKYKERLISEKTNRRLKAILSNQEKVNDALSKLLQKRSVLHGMDYVLSTEAALQPPRFAPESAGSCQTADQSKPILAELEKRVQQMYQEADAKFKTSSQSPGISCDMRIKHDARRGKMVEFVTTTPMVCSVDEASDILWKELTMYREYPDKEYKFVLGSKPNTQEKNFVMSLRSPAGLVELNGLQYLQKFDEADRAVFIVAERMLHPRKGLHFHDGCWMAVTPAASGRSLVEIYLELYMESDDGLESSPEEVAYVQNVVMGSLSNTLRKFFQTQQNSLMEKAGRIVVTASASPSAIV